MVYKKYINPIGERVLKIKRKEFLTKVVPASLVAVGFASLCKSGSQNNGNPLGNPKIMWKLKSSFPRSLDTIYGGVEVMADFIRKMSGGNFDIKVYPAREIVPSLQVMDAVQNGSVQM